MKTLTCEVCNKVFSSQQPNTRMCSKICRNSAYRDKTGRVSESEGLSTGTVGAMSEMQVALDLMKKRFSVFRALSPACFCDLIAVKDDKISRIEVRTGYESLINGKIAYSKILYGQIDLIAVYIPRAAKIYYFNSKHEPTDLTT